jgi:hypothetical protein
LYKRNSNRDLFVKPTFFRNVNSLDFSNPDTIEPIDAAERTRKMKNRKRVFTNPPVDRYFRLRNPIVGQITMVGSR